MIFNKWIIKVLILFSIFSCNNEKTKKIGPYLVRAKFINDSTIEGVAKYFNDKKQLVSEVTYKAGIKNGPAINYYPNGKIKDSFNYKDGLLNEWQYAYDNNGFLLMKKYNYFDLSVGSHYYYTNNRLTEYSFFDFDKNELVDCSYDSSSKCRIMSVALKPITNEVINDNRNSSLNLFIYFPHPPAISVTTTIGLINDKQETKKETIINGDRVFLDTTLELSEKKWNYFVSYRFLDAKDSLDKVYFFLLHP